ncbi:unnamed protein product, partial [Effrenium voratum]
QRLLVLWDLPAPVIFTESLCSTGRFCKRENMAFAADPTMGGLNKAAALKGNLGWKSKEDGSVSNSSNGSTTTGRESGCDDEATKTNRDGSGSSSGSGSTAKAYKESAQDESCSSGSRSEQAQDVQDSEPKQQNSLKTA